MILVVRVSRLKMTGDVKIVDKPPETAGPMVPAIPLALARISAEVLIPVRGPARSTVEFYSWLWTSGKHGGPRLFHPDPGALRVVFLRDEGGYLHTVGDYPSYDLELSSRWLPALLSAWKSGEKSNADPLQRLVELRMRAEFESLPESQLREDFGEAGPRVNHNWAFDLPDLVGVAGPFFVASQIDDICRHSTNPSARFAACFVTAEFFPGRCAAYDLARNATAADETVGDFMVKRLCSCESLDRRLIADLSAGSEWTRGFFGWSMAPQHRRETMRVYASAMDPGVHHVACEVAAQTQAARDIPECAALEERK